MNSRELEKQSWSDCYHCQYPGDYSHVPVFLLSQKLGKKGQLKKKRERMMRNVREQDKVHRVGKGMKEKAQRAGR